MWWSRQPDPIKGVVFGDQFVLFRPPTPATQPQPASSALRHVGRAGPVARPRPPPSFWMGGRSLVDGGVVIDVEAGVPDAPTGLVWVRTEASSDEDAAATHHARRTRKVRAHVPCAEAGCPGAGLERMARPRCSSGPTRPRHSPLVPTASSTPPCQPPRSSLHSAPAGEVHVQPLRHTEHQARQPPRVAGRLRLRPLCRLSGRAQASGQPGGECLCRPSSRALIWLGTRVCTAQADARLARLLRCCLAVLHPPRPFRWALLFFSGDPILTPRRCFTRQGTRPSPLQSCAAACSAASCWKGRPGSGSRTSATSIRTTSTSACGDVATSLPWLGCKGDSDDAGPNMYSSCTLRATPVSKPPCTPELQFSAFPSPALPA